MRSIRFVLVVALLSATGAARADAPAYLPIQGILEDAAGVPLDGDVSMRFTLYNADIGGTLLWSESQMVEVADGLFAAYLGDVSPLALSLFRDNGSVFLGVTVGSDAEMPRFQIATTGFAAFAQYAGDAATVGGHSPTEFQLAGSAVGWADITGIPADLADGTDNDTTYTAGLGLTLTGTVFAADRTQVEGWARGVAYDTVAELRADLDRVYAAASHTHAWGDLTGVPAGFADGTDNDTTYTSGTGITITGTTISADTAGLQARVSGTCAPNSSIRAINADGTVTCETDDSGGTYTAGTGIVITGTGIALDTAFADGRYVNVGENDSITTWMIANGTIGSADVNTTQVQARVGGTCGAGSAIRMIGADGTVTCETDDDTAYTAGAGLTLTGTTLAVAFGGTGSAATAARSDHTQAWTSLTGVPAGFADGIDDGASYTAGAGLSLTGTTFAVTFGGTGSATTAARSDHTQAWTSLTGVPAGFADGTDDGTTYTAGAGLTLAGTTFAADTAYLQRRATGTCAAGSSIRVINADGTVVCETDDGTTYTAGAGLTLTGTTFAVTFGGTGSATTAARSDHTQAWTSLTGVPAGFADGTDNDSGGDITEVVAGQGLAGGGTSGSITLTGAATAHTSAGATTTIATTCTNYGDGQVSVAATGPGYVIVMVDAWIHISKTVNENDRIRVHIGTNATECSWTANHYAAIHSWPTGTPTGTTVYEQVSTTGRFQVATAGTYTYYLNGIHDTGTTNNPIFYYANLNAIFVPD
jgi:hypothetical protein